MSRILPTLAASALALALASAPAAAADYFVSPAGADTNSGLSFADAFRTIQKGADVAGPGDTVHLQAGTYDEVVRLTRSGSMGSPITITADGNPVVMDAQSRGCPLGKGVSSDAPRQAFLGANIHDVVLDGIEITRYCFDAVIFQFSNDVTIRNLHVHHNALTLRTQAGNGIAVQGGANVLIENNLVTDNVPRSRLSGSGIAVDGTDQAIVRNNVADRNNGNGILIEDGTNVLVEGNRARYNVGDFRSWGTAGIWVDGGHTITVRGNWFEGNVWDGLEITDETPSDPYDYEIYDNVAIGNWYGIWLDGIGGSGTPLDLIYGNTFVDNTSAGMRLVGQIASGLASTRVYGNLVAQLDVDQPALQVDPGTYADVVLDRNLYFRQGSTTPISWGFQYGRPYGTTPRSVADRTFAEYQALSGWDASGLSADPSFVDSGAQDYHLLAGSPALDVGSPLYAAPIDYDGHARPSGGGPDIGAFEGSGPCGGGACDAGTPGAIVHDSSVLPVKPVSVTIPSSATSVTRLLKVRVRNGDSSPRDWLGHRIQLLASDGDCPAGTVTGVPAFHFQRLRGPESSDFVVGGRTLPARVLLTLPRAAFAGVSHCTLQLRVETPLPGNVDPVPGNDSVGVELFVDVS
jgi:parallel beta-helix repeat protein